MAPTPPPPPPLVRLRSAKSPRYGVDRPAAESIDDASGAA